MKAKFFIIILVSLFLIGIIHADYASFKKSIDTLEESKNLETHKKYLNLLIESINKGIDSEDYNELIIDKFSGLNNDDKIEVLKNLKKTSYLLPEVVKGVMKDFKSSTEKNEVNDWTIDWFMTLSPEKRSEIWRGLTPDARNKAFQFRFEQQLEVLKQNSPNVDFKIPKLTGFGDGKLKLWNDDVNNINFIQETNSKAFVYLPEILKYPGLKEINYENGKFTYSLENGNKISFSEGSLISNGRYISNWDDKTKAYETDIFLPQFQGLRELEGKNQGELKKYPNGEITIKDNGNIFEFKNTEVFFNRHYISSNDPEEVSVINLDYMKPDENSFVDAIGYKNVVLKEATEYEENGKIKFDVLYKVAIGDTETKVFVDKKDTSGLNNYLNIILDSEKGYLFKGKEIKDVDITLNFRTIGIGSITPDIINIENGRNIGFYNEGQYLAALQIGDDGKLYSPRERNNQQLIVSNSPKTNGENIVKPNQALVSGSIPGINIIDRKISEPNIEVPNPKYSRSNPSIILPDTVIEESNINKETSTATLQPADTSITKQSSELPKQNYVDNIYLENIPTYTPIIPNEKKTESPVYDFATSPFQRSFSDQVSIEPIAEASPPQATAHNPYELAPQLVDIQKTNTDLSQLIRTPITEPPVLSISPINVENPSPALSWHSQNNEIAIAQIPRTQTNIEIPNEKIPVEPEQQTPSTQVVQNPQTSSENYNPNQQSPVRSIVEESEVASSSITPSQISPFANYQQPEVNNENNYYIPRTQSQINTMPVEKIAFEPEQPSPSTQVVQNTLQYSRPNSVESSQQVVNSIAQQQPQTQNTQYNNNCNCYRVRRGILFRRWR